MGFSPKKTVNVGVSITIDNRLEAVVIDSETQKVYDYKKVPLEYNFQTKEISDYMLFATTLKSMLFDEMGLNPKNVNLTLTIPSIHFATAQLPATVDTPSAINAALAAMAQDSYLFKRHEPVVAYQTYTSSSKDTVPVIYSAIQENVASQIRDIIIDVVGVENFSLNNPYASIVNALDYLGIIDNQVNSGEVWNLVQITNNGFTLFSMIGTKILEINDMPLPLKTFAPEEIYESMALSLQNNLSIYPASSLFVISRTELLSAQILLQNMELRGDIAFLENNKFAQEPLMEIDEIVDTDLAKVISVEVIGSAITNKNSPMNLCYITNKDKEEEVYGYINIFGKEIPVSESLITKALLGCAGLFVILGGLLWLGVTSFNDQLSKQVKKYESEKQSIERKIDNAKGKAEGNVENIIAGIAKNNKATIDYYTAISVDIPSNIWLTYFYTDASGAFAIKGNTADINVLYSFFKDLRNDVEGSSIILTKLEYNDIDALLSDEGLGNTTITFEITNDEYKNAINMMASQTPAEGAENSEAKPSDEKKKDGSKDKKDKKTPSSPSKDDKNKANDKDDVNLDDLSLPDMEPPTK